MSRIDATPRSDSVSEHRYTRRDDNAVLGPSTWDRTSRVSVPGGVQHPVGGGISHPDLRAKTSGDLGRSHPEGGWDSKPWHGVSRTRVSVERPRDQPGSALVMVDHQRSSHPCHIPPEGSRNVLRTRSWGCGGMGGTGSPEIMGNLGIELLADEMIVRIDMFVTLMCVE